MLFSKFDIYFCLCRHVEVVRIVTNCDGINFEVLMISFLCRISAQGFKNVGHLVYSKECWKYSRQSEWFFPSLELLLLLLHCFCLSESQFKIIEIVFMQHAYFVSIVSKTKWGQETRLALGFHFTSVNYYFIVQEETS